MKPTEQRTQTPSPRNGRFAVLGGLLGAQGSGAPFAGASGVPSTGGGARRGSGVGSLSRPYLSRASRFYPGRGAQSLFVLALVLVALLLVGAASAFAAPPEVPALAVEQLVPSPVSPASEAVLRGVLNPGKEGGLGSFEVGTYEFLYAKSSSSCKGEAKSPEPPGIALGAGKEAVSATISGLEANTTYTACVVVRNGIKGEESVSSKVTFTTAIPPEAPENTGSARLVAAGVVRLTGVINPNTEGNPGHYQVVYRKSATECQFVLTAAEEKQLEAEGQLVVLEEDRKKVLENRATPVVAFSSALQHPVVVDVGGLLRSSEYTFCLLARNEAGEVALGAPVTFATPDFGYRQGISFGEPGSAAGQLQSPEGVAVNEESHDVYVADKGNARVDEFKSDGTFVRAWGWGVADGTAKLETCTSPCQAGMSGSSPGEFTAPAFIAVDNSSGASKGDVYVGDPGDATISKFTAAGTLIGSWGVGGQLVLTGEALFGVTVDSAGDLWARFDTNPFGSEDVKEFSEAAGLLQTVSTNLAPGKSPGIAVDPTGNSYIVSNSEGARFEAGTGAFLAAFGGGGTQIAVNPSTGDVLLDEGSGVARFVAPVEAGAAAAEVFGGEGVSESFGVAVDGGSVESSVFLSQRAAGDVVVFNDVFAPRVVTSAASGVSETALTLNGQVSPEGEPVTECFFEYGTSTGYGQKVACEQSPAEINAKAGEGEPVSVSANVSGLAPAVERHFRLLAANANENSLTAGSDVAVRRPAVDDESVSLVSATGATFAAQVNPLGLPTSYRVEYGLSTAYGSSAPLPEGAAGSGVADVSVAVAVGGLAQGTLYHYRFVAHNALGAVEGKDKSFSTQLAGGAGLPDGRAWEMVSPPDKFNAVLAMPHEGGIVQASEDGSAITYASSESIVADPEGNANLSQVLSRRGAADWSTQDIATPHAAQSQLILGQGQEYRAFSPDLSLALVAPFGPTAFGGAPTGENTYVRDNRTGSYTFVAATNRTNKEREDKKTAEWSAARAAEATARGGGNPTGPWRAFMSEEAETLVGYDNHDASERGVRDEEVFLENTATKTVVCVSCNPTGARPTGVTDEPGANANPLLVDSQREWVGRRLAGNIPGVTEVDSSFGVYTPRFLDAASGRLFFDSPDRLVPLAGAGKENVFEFEPVGVGSCTEKVSSGDVVYVAAEGGCVGLISSGTSAEESAFMDASTTGNDVFFMTAAKLLPQDVDDRFDVYDARVCSDASPCLGSEAAASGCLTADACRPAPSPQPEVFAGSSGATFSGPGNLTPESSAKVQSSAKVESAAQKRAKQLAKALKVCRAKHKRHKREACEKQARKTYGVKAGGSSRAHNDRRATR
jgi:NHL repeat